MKLVTFLLFLLVQFNLHAAIEVQPSSFDFGSVSLGEKDSRAVFTVVNSGPDHAIDCGTAQLSGANSNEFVVSFDGCSNHSLNSGARCQIVLTSRPQSYGTKLASLSWNCSSGHNISINDIKSAGITQELLPDGNFEENHNVWTIQQAPQVNFNNGLVQLHEGTSRATISQQFDLLLNRPGNYFVTFTARNLSSQDAEARILGTYVRIEKNFFGTKEVMVFTQASGTNEDLDIVFEGPFGTTNSRLEIDDIKIRAMAESPISILDGDFSADHNAWQVPTPGLAIFDNLTVTLSTSSTTRGEISQVINDVVSLQKPAFYHASLYAHNQSQSSASMNLLGHYRDIAPGYEGNKHAVVLHDGTEDNSIVKLAAPIEFHIGDQVVYDNVLFNKIENPPVMLPRITKIGDARGNHSCVVFSDNTARCWGGNSYFQLGQAHNNPVSDTIPRLFPTVPLTMGIKDIASGIDHTCAILMNNHIQCWGGNSARQLGFSPRNNIGIALPQTQEIDIGEDVAQLTLGDKLSCALTSSGKVKCWGRSNQGQLGLGFVPQETLRERTPWGWYYQTVYYDHAVSASSPFIQVDSSQTPVKQISAFLNHVCVAFIDGNAKCWGYNRDGQLGTGNINTIGDNEHPSSINNINFGVLSPVKKIVAGGQHSCALFENGSVKCWGKSYVGALGIPGQTQIRDPQVAPVVDLGGTAKDISAGAQHTCVIMENDDLRCFGAGRLLGLNSDTNIGDNEHPSSVPPVNLGGGAASSFSSSSSHTCILSSNENMICFGANGEGQLGLGRASGTFVGSSQARVSEVTQTVGLAAFASIESDIVVGGAPLAVNFDASLSRPSLLLGRIINYHWNFGDGTTALGKNIQHLFQQVGTYNVVLTITDDLGQTASTSKIINVTSAATIVPKVSAIALELSNTSFYQMAMNLYAKDGQERPASLVWHTANASIATIDSKGVIRPISTGRTHIWASFQGLNSSLVTVDVFSAGNAPVLLLPDNYFTSQWRKGYLGLTTNINGSLLETPWSRYWSAVNAVNQFNTELIPHAGLNQIQFKKTDRQGNNLGTFEVPFQYFDGLDKGLAFLENTQASIQLNPAITFPQDSFSVMFWYRPLSTASQEPIVILRDSQSQPMISFKHLSGYERIAVELKTTTQQLIGLNSGRLYPDNFSWSPFSLEQSDWVHIVLTYNHNTQKLALFRNGFLNSEFDVGENIIRPVLDASFSIQASNAHRFLFDELRIFSRALEQSEIRLRQFTSQTLSDPDLFLSVSFQDDAQVQYDDQGQLATVTLGSSSQIDSNDATVRQGARVLDSALAGLHRVNLKSATLEVEYPEKLSTNEIMARLSVVDKYSLNLNVHPNVAGPIHQLHPISFMSTIDKSINVTQDISQLVSNSNNQLVPVSLISDNNLSQNPSLLLNPINQNDDKVEVNIPAWVTTLYQTEIDAITQFSFSDTLVEQYPIKSSIFEHAFLKRFIVPGPGPHTLSLEYTLDGATIQSLRAGNVGRVAKLVGESTIDFSGLMPGNNTFYIYTKSDASQLHAIQYLNILVQGF